MSYSGLLHAVTQEHLFAENKEKLISAAINSLISKVNKNIIVLTDLPLIKRVRREYSNSFIEFYVTSIWRTLQAMSCITLTV